MTAGQIPFGEGVAMQILADAGADAEMVRDEVVRQLGGVVPVRLVGWATWG